MTSSRQLVRAFFRGNACPRPPLLPLSFYHVSRLDGTPLSALTQDPTRLTRALMDQHRLLEVDCVTLKFDAALWADAVGMSVDWTPVGPVVQWDSAAGREWPPEALERAPVQVLLEVIRRLHIELRREAPILAVLPGPVDLWNRACPELPDKLEETVNLVRTLAEAACQAGADLVVLQEGGTGGDEGRTASAVEPVCNTVRYYNAFPILQVSAPPERNVADALLFGTQIGLDALPQDVRAGTFVPPVCFESAEERDGFASRLQASNRPVFVTTDDDVLLSHPVETNVELFKVLRSVEWQ